MARPSALQTPSDIRLRAEILADPDIRRAVSEIDKQSKQADTRRHLLANAVRLTPALAPKVHAIVEDCRARLEYAESIELYVYADARLNAAAARPEHGRSFVLFSSGLLEALDDDELAFVLGHELGHHIFEHHELPIGALMRGPGLVRPAQALQLFAWSRYAEISADRAGLYCCGKLEAVGSTLFKLASGLKRSLTENVIDAMLAQYDDIEAAGAATAEDAPRVDWITTHPFSPLRIKAAKYFAESSVMDASGRSIDELEVEVARVMSVMEPGYLRESSDGAKAMRRFLLAAGMVLAGADGSVDEVENAAIDELLGAGTVTRRLDLEALRADLPTRIADVVERVAPHKRVQVMRDLCLVARADGESTEQERALLESWARDLGLADGLVTCAIENTLDLD